MPVRSKSRSNMAVAWSVAGSVAVIICLVAGAVLSGSGGPTINQDITDRSRPSHHAPSTTQRRPPPEAAARTPRTPARVEATPPPPPACARASFAELVDRLCVLSGRTAALAQQDEHEAARTLDEEARVLLEQVLATSPNAGELALSMVVEMPSTASGAHRAPGENIRLGVLQVILDAALARHYEHGDRARAAALTQALLDTMPVGANPSEMGDRVLHRRPYLQAAHEPAVMRLLALADQGEFSREVATRLLLTLWDNLEAAGIRSSDELSRLALARLDDHSPSQLVAACRQLLSDPRFRELAIAWLRERDDAALTSAVAALAGRELPPTDALIVLRELCPMLQHTRGIFLSVGVRAPEVVADAYRTQLAADTHPQLRRELVMGVGMLPGATGLPIAKLALDHDPSPEVRLQAMFVHTVQGDPESAEAAMHQILDDPTIARDPSHLGSVVLALENLEHDDVNVVARVGARLQAMALTPRSRALLDELLARSIPGGGR